MDYMHTSGTEPSSVFLSQNKVDLKFESDAPKAQT